MARFERRPADAKRVDSWRWRNDPVVSGTRELNGLRVVMALLNNWDLKNSNTAVYESAGQQVYAVSDLGATFGSSGYAIPSKKSDLDSYMDSKFIVKVTPAYVDFNSPSRPPLLTVFALPVFIKRIQMRQIAKQVPIEDVRWITQYLAQLSPRQIRSAFRASGYSPAEVEGFSRVIENRIAQLTEL
jgi:hypothetical protein